MVERSKVLAIIPARGGSKGLPRKNLLPLCGKPLIAWTIGQAAASKNLTRCIVSSDDTEIIAVARSFGADVPFIRPEEYARDDSSTYDVTFHALTYLKEQGEGYDLVAQLEPTSPLRKPGDIDAAVELLWQSKLDSVVTVCPVKNHPYFIYSRDVDGRLRPLLDIPNRPLRRQDLPPYVTDTQAVMVSRTSYLKMSGDTAPVINFGSVAGLEVAEKIAFDIDTALDLMIADALMRQEVRPYP